LLHACQLAQSQPTHCIYVGDAARDIEAGQRAGMQTVAALYGYIAENENPHTWNATTTISKPLDLLNWLALC
jgi:N-acetyl-D-muramate 6-phosphate phosphatase